MLLYVYVFMYVQFESLKVSACLATLFCWVTHFDTWRSVYFFVLMQQNLNGLEPVCSLHFPTAQFLFYRVCSFRKFSDCQTNNLLIVATCMCCL